MPSVPLPAQENDRLATLDHYEILDTGPEAAFDRIARVARHSFDVPMAMVSLVDETRQWFKAREGLDVTETKREISFCTHAILQDAVMVVPDATQDPRFADNPLVTGAPFIRFYAGAPITTRGGYNLGTVCVLDNRPRAFDETDRRTLADLAAMVVDELELRHLNREAVATAEAERNLRERHDSFLSTVAHELRAPLTSIHGMLSLIEGGRAGTLPDTAARYVAIAHRNARTLNDLIDDLLDVQKLEQGKLAFDFAPLRLDTLVARTLEDLAGYAAANDIALHQEESAAVTVDADATRLQQALTNLVSNAVKVSPRGATVRTGAVPVAEAAPWVRLYVRDEGPGVPPAYRARLFEKFTQGPVANSQTKGTGLGLTIAKTIAEAHGGAIGFDTEDGAGSTFYIDLPLAPASAAITD